MTFKTPVCLGPIKVFRDMAERSYFRKVFRSDFVRKVAETLITRVLLIGLGIVSSVIVARTLGPEGRGFYAIAISLGGLGVQFGNLGLHASNTYYVAKKPDLLPTLISNSIAVSFLIGGIGSILFWGVLSIWPYLVKIEGVLLALTLVSIPFGLVYLLLQNLLIGIHEIHSFNKIEIGNRIASLILVSGIILVQKVSVETLFLTHLSALFISCAWILLQFKSRSPLIPRPSFAVFKNNLQYGFKAYVAALFAFLVLRSDLLLLQYMLGAEQVGLYAVAVSVADLTLLAPTVIGTLMFPRLAAMGNDRERWRYARLDM
jgi:O-antigen/teichoic acid export membrane protein